MSSMINMKWECPACMAMNPQECIKPRPFQASVFTSACAQCESQVQLRVQKAKGQPGRVQYDCVDIVISESGREKLNKRVKAKQKQTSVNTELTKGE